MSFSVDQFMQVKCKFTLTSETESSESIYTNNEQIRLCKTVQLDTNNNSILIVMVCSNETSNNHILAYYIERPPGQCSQTNVAYNEYKVDENNSTSPTQDHSLTMDNDDSTASNAITFTRLAQLTDGSPQIQASPTPSPNGYKRRSKTRPKIIVKQIYYHNYNEDIVAICLNQTGTKLVLINASSTIYIIPIKNILLNIHVQQLRSSLSGSMYYYDASILNPSSQDQRWSFNDPIDVVCWDSHRNQKSTLVVASREGKLTFISVDSKREVCSTSVGEPIKRLDIIQDGSNLSLLITCVSFNQYRQVLESDDLKEQVINEESTNLEKPRSRTNSLMIRLHKSRFTRMKVESASSNSALSDSHSWASKPIPVKPPPPLSSNSGQASATRVIQRVFTPSANNLGVQTGLSFSDVRDRPVTLLGYQSPNLISLIDVLGTRSRDQSLTNLQNKLSSSQNSISQTKYQERPGEPRLVRFYSCKHYVHQAQRPQTICKLDSLDPDELIIDLILTDRFVAYTTDRDRCIINSRNCCKLKNSSVPHHAPRIESLSPLVKEIAFNHEEKIVLLVKSPVSNDQDNIIDSFLLITTRSIYSIEARHNCRELFINLIDSHLAIKRTLFMSKSEIDSKESTNYSLERTLRHNGKTHRAFNLDFQFTTTTSGYDTHMNAESNLLINNFLQHREVYERICHDSQAFSTLFKLELFSLYEAYADRLLQRGHFDLANRFFQMASFDHSKILGKYIRVGYIREAIDYVKDVLNDENDFRRVMTENEKIEISKMAFECLLAKTVAERGKVNLFKGRLDRACEARLLSNLKKLPQNPLMVAKRHPPDIFSGFIRSNSRHPWRNSPFDLCEHSPQGQDAKLSATTIVPQGDDDEETLTSNTGTNSGGLLTSSKMTRVVKNNNRARLECEKALIDFAKNFMPSAMYEYTVDQLLDFDLIDIIHTIAQTDAQILSFLKLVIRYREEDRLIFKLCKLDTLTELLGQLNETHLTRVSTYDRQFLEFLTSERVNRALVKDISLTCDFYGYQHTLVQFRKYSFAASRQLETLRQLVQMNALEKDLGQDHGQANSFVKSSSIRNAPLIDDDDDDANDGMCFKLKLKGEGVSSGDKILFNGEQKQIAENIFIEFLNACLDESTDDSCRLWSTYINYYLNYIGSLDLLEADILRMIETVGDCRLAISLYKAIHRDESCASKTHDAGKSPSIHTVMNGLVHKSYNNGISAAVSAAQIVDNLPINIARTETMEKFYNLNNLFENEFLMRLLEKTLDLLTQSVDLDALSIATMC